MESLPTLYEAAQLYAFFCLVTAICGGIINASVLMKLQVFKFTPSITYLLTTMFLCFIFAPIFFVIFILYGDSYKLALYTAMVAYFEKDVGSDEE